MVIICFEQFVRLSLNIYQRCIIVQSESKTSCGDMSMWQVVWWEYFKCVLGCVLSDVLYNAGILRPTIKLSLLAFSAIYSS